MVKKGALFTGMLSRCLRFIVLMSLTLLCTFWSSQKDLFATVITVSLEIPVSTLSPVLRSNPITIVQSGESNGKKYIIVEDSTALTLRKAKQENITVGEERKRFEKETAVVYLKIVLGQAMAMNLKAQEIIEMLKRDLPSFFSEIFDIDNIEKAGKDILVPMDVNYERRETQEKYKIVRFVLTSWQKKQAKEIKVEDVEALSEPSENFRTSEGTLPVEMEVVNYVEGTIPLIVPDGEEKFILNSGVLSLDGTRFLFPRVTFENKSGIRKSVIGLYIHDEKDGEAKVIDKFMLEPDMKEFVAYEDTRVIERSGTIYMAFTAVRSDATYSSFESTHDADKFLEIAKKKSRGDEIKWQWTPPLKLINGSKKLSANKNFVPFPSPVVDANGEEIYMALYRPDIDETSTIRMAVSKRGLNGPWEDYGEYMKMDPDDGWQGVSVSVTGTPYVNETFPFQFMLFHKARYRKIGSNLERHYDIRFMACDLNDPYSYYLSEAVITPSEDKLKEMGIKEWVPGVIYTCGVQLKDFDLDKNEFTFDVYYSYADAAIFMDTITIKIKPKAVKTFSGSTDNLILGIVSDETKQGNLDVLKEEIPVNTFDGMHIVDGQTDGNQTKELAKGFMQKLNIPDDMQEDVMKQYSDIVNKLKTHFSENNIDRVFIGFKREGNYIKITIRDMRENIDGEAIFSDGDNEFKDLIGNFTEWDGGNVTFEFDKKRLVFSKKKNSIVQKGGRSMLSEGLRITIDLDLKKESDREFEISEKIRKFQPNNWNLMNTVKGKLNEQPVDIFVSMDLIHIDDVNDIDENMKTWAYLMLMNNELGLDVNFIYKTSKESGLGDKHIDLLKKHIRELCKDKGKDADEIISRINSEHLESNTMQVYILKREDIDSLRNLEGNPLFVAMDEQGPVLSNFPMWDFPAAYALSLAQAALVKAISEGNSEEILEDLLPKIRAVCGRKFPGHNIKFLITEDTLRQLVSSDFDERKKIAEWLSLPPITRRATARVLHEYHAIMHAVISSV